MTIEAMKQALEALENTTPTGFNMERDKQFYAAITALRTAIAEAEKQDPVAYVTGTYAGRFVVKPVNPAMVLPVNMALYTTPPAAQRQHHELLCVCGASWSIDSKGNEELLSTPPQRQPLTEEKIDDIWNRYCDEMGEASINDAYDIARAIEAAHGIGEKK